MYIAFCPSVRPISLIASIISPSRAIRLNDHLLANVGVMLAVVWVDPFTIEKKLQMLAAHPELGQERPELGNGLRCITAGSYVLVYRPTADEIELVRAVHSARDIDALF